MPGFSTRQLFSACVGLVLLSTGQWGFSADNQEPPDYALPGLEQATIHQEVSFKCKPDLLFNALIAANDFSSFTGYPAEILAQEGGKFSLFGGQITGMNIELQQRNIVQAWRVAAWPEGIYSMVRFTLQPDGDGATLVLDQAGFPTGTGEHLQTGWHSMYWEGLTKFCESR